MSCRIAVIQEFEEKLSYTDHIFIEPRLKL